MMLGCIRFYSCRVVLLDVTHVKPFDIDLPLAPATTFCVAVPTQPYRTSSSSCTDSSKTAEEGVQEVVDPSIHPSIVYPSIPFHLLSSTVSATTTTQQQQPRNNNNHATEYNNEKEDEDNIIRIHSAIPAVVIGCSCVSSIIFCCYTTIDNSSNSLVDSYYYWHYGRSPSPPNPPQERPQGPAKANAQLCHQRRM